MTTIFKQFIASFFSLSLCGKNHNSISSPSNQISGKMKALGRKSMKNSNTRKKRIKLVNNIRGIVDYLKTDSYLYSHLITSSSLSHHHVHKSGFGKNEGILRHNERESKEKLMKYLKSDTYMYAPLEDVRHRDHGLAKNVISSPTAEELEFTRVTRTVISKKIALQTKRGADNPISDKQANVSKGGRRDVGVVSPTTPEIPLGRKQASPLHFDSVRMMKNMRNVVQELNSTEKRVHGA